MLSYQTAMQINDDRDVRAYITKRTCVSFLFSTSFMVLILGECANIFFWQYFLWKKIGHSSFPYFCCLCSFKVFFWANLWPIANIEYVNYKKPNTSNWYVNWAHYAKPLRHQLKAYQMRPYKLVKINTIANYIMKQSAVRIRASRKHSICHLIRLCKNCWTTNCRPRCNVFNG